jgi:hypothetical protein
MPADTVADAVVLPVERDRAEVWAPRWLRIAATVRALARGAYRRLAIRFGGQLEVTTQRNPMCVVALSCDWGERAAGR